jgi:hypothetical protein
MVCLAILAGVPAAFVVDAAESPSNSPATVAEAAKVLNLATFPLVGGAERPQHRNVAGLFYNAPDTVKQVFEFQQKQLADQRWKELPNSYVTDQTASATFGRDGFSLSVTVFPTGKAGVVNVMLTNHGNVELGKLPVPPGTKPFYSGPVNAAYITERPTVETAETCRKLLMAKGWQPYGKAGDSMYFKQNAVRLNARVSAAPAQGGKTVIDYSTVLMSVDLPAPAETEQLQYADVTTQLLFDTKAKQADVVGFYRETLAKMAWEATTEKPIRIGFKNTLIFRNPQKDMLTLEIYEVGGRNRVILKHQSAAEVADMERQYKEETERRKMTKEKPLPKLVVMLPADANEVQQTKNRIEFKVVPGKAKAIVESWRRQFVKDGWKEEAATLHAMAGSLSFAKGDHSLTVIYADTGYLPAEVTIHAAGVELERTAEKTQ